MLPDQIHQPKKIVNISDFSTVTLSVPMSLFFTIFWKNSKYQWLRNWLSFCSYVVRIYENVRENFFPLSDVSLMIWWIGFPFLHLTYCCQMHYGPYFSSKLCKDYNAFEMLMYISQAFFQNQKSWFSNILTMGPVCLSPLRGRSVQVHPQFCPISNLRMDLD